MATEFGNEPETRPEWATPRLEVVELRLEELLMGY